MTTSCRLCCLLALKYPTTSIQQRFLQSVLTNFNSLRTCKLRTCSRTIKCNRHNDKYCLLLNYLCVVNANEKILQPFAILQAFISFATKLSSLWFVNLKRCSKPAEQVVPGERIYFRRKYTHTPFVFEQWHGHYSKEQLNVAYF